MPDKFFILENKLEMIKIPFSHIYYFEKIKNTDHVCVAYSGGLASFKSDLNSLLGRLDDRFLQCHKSYIANISSVVRIEKFQTYLILHFSTQINCPCSFMYKSEVLQKWKS